MGAPKKYTPEQLEKKVNQYFKKITRIVAVTEPKPTGEYDDHGHMIFEDVPVLNRYGKPVETEEYIIPPSFSDLAIFLGIHRSTWSEYSDSEKHPEFTDTTSRARGRIQAYLERELLTRPGKDIAGVKFNLEQNFGQKEKLEISGSETLEQCLAQALESGEGQTL